MSYEQGGEWSTKNTIKKDENTSNNVKDLRMQNFILQNAII